MEITKNKQTVTTGMPWNTMLGLAQRLKDDQRHKDYLLIVIGSHFGLRIGDLLTVRWEEVLGKDCLLIKEQKTGKARSITFNNRAKEALLWANDFRKHGEIFLLSNRWGDPVTVSYVNKKLKKIFEKYQVKVPKASSHTLRKTFGRRVYESDGKSERSLVYLSEIFGHSSIAITRKYIGITQEQIADVYLNL